jgi:hypothetical protein
MRTDRHVPLRSDAMSMRMCIHPETQKSTRFAPCCPHNPNARHRSTPHIPAGRAMAAWDLDTKLVQRGTGYAMAARMSPCAPPPGPHAQNWAKLGLATPWRPACRHARRRPAPMHKTGPNGGRLRHGGSHVAMRAAARPPCTKLVQMGAGYAMAARMSPCAPPPGPHAHNCSEWGSATPWRLACRHARRRPAPMHKTGPNGGRLRHGGSHVEIGRASGRASGVLSGVGGGDGRMGCGHGVAVPHLEQLCGWGPGGGAHGDMRAAMA